MGKNKEKTPEQNYRSRKKTGIGLIVFGALLMLGGGIAYFVLRNLQPEGMPYVLALGYGALFVLVGIFAAATAKKKYNQEVAEEAENTKKAEASAAVNSHATSKIDLSLSQSGGILNEVDGRDILKMLEHPEEVEKITFRDSNNDIYQFDLLWGNVYDGATYVVAACYESGEYIKYIIRINNDAPSTAYYEINDGIREAIKNDFVAAMNAYTGNVESAENSGGYTAAATAKVSPAESKKKRTVFFVMLAIYALIIAAGLLVYLMFADTFEGDMLTVAKAVAFAYLMITPSFLIYFGSHNPFGMKKGGATALKVLGIIGLVLCDIFGLTTISNLPDVENGVMGFVVHNFIPIALIVATVGYIVAFMVLCRGRSSVWYLGLGIAVTLFFPVATALIIAAVVIWFVLTVIRWLLSCIGIMASDTAFGRGFMRGWSGKIDPSVEYEITDENGYTHSLTKYEGNTYRDASGTFWVTDDNGSTFRRK